MDNVLSIFPSAEWEMVKLGNLILEKSVDVLTSNYRDQNQSKSTELISKKKLQFVQTVAVFQVYQKSIDLLFL